MSEVILEKPKKVEDFAYKAHVMSDISSYSSKGHGNMSGIRILRNQRLVWSASDIDVHTADDHTIGGRICNISFSLNISLFHKV